tara:strand:- start:16114 stop:18444 length:2331 start_codon:yes stop_codon:yes gene_type:complete
MKLLIFFILLIGLSPHFALAEKAGAALLRSFQCEGLGSETASIRSSISNLKDMMKSLNGPNNSCAEVGAAIAELPSIEETLARIENSSKEQRIDELEATINEALANLDYVERKVSPEEQYLYPSSADLQNIVVTSRSELLKLKADISVEDSELMRRNKIQGLAELDQLGMRLADAVTNNPDCFEEQEELRRYSLTALVGISGFFMSSPIGVATTAAARNLQNLFRIFGGSNSRYLRSVEPILKAELGLGFGCALESLSQQHCNLIRKRDLLSRVSGPRSCREGDPNCQEANVCHDCPEENALARSNKVTKDLLPINDWVNLRDLIGDSSNQVVNQQRLDARKMIVLVAEDISQSLSNEINNARSLSSEVQRKKRFYEKAIDILDDLNRLMVDGEYYPDSGSSASVDRDARYQLQGDLIEEELDYAGLSIMLGNPQEARRLHNDLLAKYNAYRKIQYDAEYDGTYEPITRLSSPTLIRYIEDTDAIKNILNDFKARFSTAEGLETIASGINSFKANGINRLSTEPSDARRRDLATRFYVGSADNEFRSPNDSLKNILAYLDFAESKLKGTPEGKFTDFKSLRTRISNVTTVSDAILQKDTPTDSDIKSLTAKMTELLGPNQEFINQVSTIATNVVNYDSRTKGEASRETLFRDSQALVRDALNISSNAELFSNIQDVNGAMELSERQIKAFSAFFKRDKGELKDLLDPEEENSLSEYNRNQLCFQILGMSNPKDFAESCKGTKITSPDGRERHFDALINAPLEERVCALPLFRDSMR